MYGYQCGEFLCGHWGLKGKVANSNLLFCFLTNASVNAE